MAGSCEHGNELSVFEKDDEILDYMNDNYSVLFGVGWRYYYFWRECRKETFLKRQTK
jgi:hypothetical protein